MRIVMVTGSFPGWLGELANPGGPGGVTLPLPGRSVTNAAAQSGISADISPVFRETSVRDVLNQNATGPTGFKVAFEGHRDRQVGGLLEAGRVVVRGTVASEAWADEQAGDMRAARSTCSCATRCGRPGSRRAKATPIPARMATAKKADWKPSVRATSWLAPVWAAR